MYDTSKLRELTDGDNEFIVRLLQTFIEQIEKELPLLEYAIKQKHWKNSHKITHKLKPSIEILNVTYAIEPIRNIVENTRHQININKIESDFDILQAALKKTIITMKNDMN